MDRLRFVLATCALLLGVAHIIYGILQFPKINLNLIWFAGAGVAMMIGALANFGGRAQNDIQRRVINVLVTSYTLAILLYAPLPQVFLAVGLFGGLLALSFLRPAGPKSYA